MNERRLRKFFIAFGDDQPFAMFSQVRAVLVNDEMLNDHKYSLFCHCEEGAFPDDTGTARQCR
jgi:hypothetical protein